ncbi:UNVERIFIED_CONTAM: hypothetical protein K2H54_012370 [Gekko kuhli]
MASATSIIQRLRNFAAGVRTETGGLRQAPLEFLRVQREKLLESIGYAKFINLAFPPDLAKTSGSCSSAKACWGTGWFSVQGVLLLIAVRPLYFLLKKKKARHDFLINISFVLLELKMTGVEVLQDFFFFKVNPCKTFLCGRWRQQNTINRIIHIRSLRVQSEAAS